MSWIESRRVPSRSKRMVGDRRGARREDAGAGAPGAAGMAINEDSDYDGVDDLSPRRRASAPAAHPRRHDRRARRVDHRRILRAARQRALGEDAGDVRGGVGGVDAARRRDDDEEDPAGAPPVIEALPLVAGWGNENAGPIARSGVFS